MHNIQAVVFDMDGVIIDSQPLYFECELATLKELGVNATVEDLQAYVGQTVNTAWENVIKRFDLKVTLEYILEIEKKYKKALFIKENIVAVEGVVELIKYLYDVKKIKIGLASSSPVHFINNVLRWLDITHYFDAVVSGEIVEKSKPEPDIYLRAAEILNIDPNKCVAIEDAENGIIAASRAGMTTIGYINQNSGNQDLSQADLVIDQMNRVIAELE